MHKFLFHLTFFILSYSTVFSFTPVTMNYQGLLADNVGTPVADASYPVMFTIYDAQIAGTPVWTETQNVTTVNGLFTVLLGTVNPIFDTVFNGTIRYLGVAIGGDPELLPRTVMVTVPYAYCVSTVNGASGGYIYSKVTIGFNQFNDGDYAAIGGGSGNNINSDGEYAVISGGRSNIVSSFYSAVLGGENNLASGTFATVGAGESNEAQGFKSTVTGGGQNIASGDSSTVSGGTKNSALGSASTVSGGNLNTASIAGSTIGGGISNLSQGYVSTISGGEQNQTTDVYSTIGGGQLNSNNGAFATISGGQQNTAVAYLSTISGGTLNYASGSLSAVGGGANDSATGTYSVISGGIDHFAGGIGTVIGGGRSNALRGDAEYSTIAGGRDNFINDEDNATIGGGRNNIVSGQNGTVSGGEYNEATQYSSTVPGGFSNSASGEFSFAAGRRAKANHKGAFVWGDTTDTDIASSAINEFTVRASGGVRFFSDSGLTSGVLLDAGSGAWVSVSDSTLKRNIREVDYNAVLNKVCELPINRWSYKAQKESIEHIGPMAQDFYRLFGLGEDNRHISTLDPDGIALAAIKGLNQKLKQKDFEIECLQAQINDLKTILQQLSDQHNSVNSAFGLK